MQISFIFKEMLHFLSFRASLLQRAQQVIKNEEVLYPLSWTFGLEVSLDLLAGLNLVIVVVQTLPELIPGVPAGLPLR